MTNQINQRSLEITMPDCLIHSIQDRYIDKRVELFKELKEENPGLSDVEIFALADRKVKQLRNKAEDELNEAYQSAAKILFDALEKHGLLFTAINLEVEGMNYAMIFYRDAGLSLSDSMFEIERFFEEIEDEAKQTLILTDK